MRLPCRPTTRDIEMTYLIFIGDMLVMAFMTVLVVWASVRTNDKRLESAARIPLEDETHG